MLRAATAFTSSCTVYIEFVSTIYQSAVVKIANNVGFWISMPLKYVIASIRVNITSFWQIE